MRAILITLSLVFYAAAVFVAAAALMVPADLPPPAPPLSDHILEESLGRIAREQAASRELVADLKQTITTLQTEVARDGKNDTLEKLTREQAASRELIADLRESIASLQKEAREAERSRDAGSSTVVASAAPSEEAEHVETGARSVGELPPGESLSGEVSEGAAPGRVIAILGGGLFESGQDVLTADLRAAVENVVPVITLNPEHRVSIEGHSDSMPLSQSLGRKHDDNRMLSLSRAKLIAGLLKGQGVPGKRIIVIGYGETRPLASNTTEEGRAENRRVEIRLIPPSEEPVE
jgi:flagellar motor protein MotB